MSAPRAPLADLRVLDLLEGDRGVFAAKLLTTLGAEVIKVEPPEGDRLRGDAPFLGEERGRERSLRWHHYRAGNESLVLDLRGSAADRVRLAELAASADVVLENLAVGELDALGLGYETLAAANPGLVMASITPFGQTGPRREWLGSDLVGYAVGGMMSLTGEPDEPPVRLGGGQAHQFAGMYAAMGVLAAIARRAVTGVGTRVDVSVQEAVASSIADAGVTYFQFNDGLNPGRVGTEHPIVVPVLVSPCADGHMLIDCLEQHQFRGLVSWARDNGAYVDPLDDPALDVAMNRLPLREMINALIEAALAGFAKDDVYEPLQSLRVPSAPVSSVPDLESNAQLAARSFFAEVELTEGGAKLKTAGSPFRFEANSTVAPDRGPRLGEHGEAGIDPARKQAETGAVRRRGRPWASGPRALDGIRVLDFSWALAGPWCGRMLAREGAEVIRIESSKRLDALRHFAADPEEAGAFINANSGKLGISLDLSDPEGAALARRLAAEADVVLDNFRPGVMERLGLDHAKLREVNPEIITCSLPAQGETGPHREYVAYGPVLHALAGFTYMTGHADGPPSAICTGFVDQLAAAHAAIGILAAIHHRDLTGEGQHVEISQFEASIGMLDSVVLDYFANGNVRGRIGNADQNLAPHGAYRCRGEDEWLTVAVTADEQWPALAAAIGRADLAADPGLAEAAGRRAAAADLDAAIGAWSAERDAEAAMIELQEAGVPAAKVQRVGDMLERDPQLAARGFYEATDHPVKGEVIVDGGAFRIEAAPGDLHRRPGPLLGQDTRVVLEELLGLDPAEIERLAAAGTIGCIEDRGLERAAADASRSA
jgi:crotonobetainyl-CoA:carnitine CoA-transferase CaiB-like acyl-CoA transferase